MKKRMFLAISTLALALFSAGCLLEPLTPEEEAELRADMEQYEAMNGKGTPSDEEGEPDRESGLDREFVHGDIGADSSSSIRDKPDPTPWVTSASDNKPDPTPWRPMSGTVTFDLSSPRTITLSRGDKPDPTPWMMPR